MDNQYTIKVREMLDRFSEQMVKTGYLYRLGDSIPSRYNEYCNMGSNPIYNYYTKWIGRTPYKDKSKKYNTNYHIRDLVEGSYYYIEFRTDPCQDNYRVCSKPNVINSFDFRKEGRSDTAFIAIGKVINGDMELVSNPYNDNEYPVLTVVKNAYKNENGKLVKAGWYITRKGMHTPLYKIIKYQDNDHGSWTKKSLSGDGLILDSLYIEDDINIVINMTNLKNKCAEFQESDRIKKEEEERIQKEKDEKIRVKNEKIKLFREKIKNYTYLGCIAPGSNLKNEYIDLKKQIDADPEAKWEDGPDYECEVSSRFGTRHGSGTMACDKYKVYYDYYFDSSD